MDEPYHINSELLSAQAGWVRNLARGLVADAHLAEDVAQEALVAALERPPRRDRGSPELGQGRLRAWLGGVVRNRLRMAVRRESGRRAHEAAVAHPESVEDERTQELAARARLLIEDVMALDEPYRSTVILRYYESLGTAEIARRTGTSPGAVRTRLSRALDRLRASIDRRHGGDRSAWALAFANWSREGASVGQVGAGVATGGNLMIAKIATLVASSALLVTAVMFTRGATDPALAVPQGSPAADVPEQRLTAVTVASVQALPVPHDDRVPVPPAERDTLAAPRPHATVRGQVTGEDDRGVAGAEVCVQVQWVAGVVRTRTDRDGHYEVTLENLPVASPHVLSAPEVTVLASAPGYQQEEESRNLWLNPVIPKPEARIDLKLKAGFEWIARVVDANGEPVRARVLLHAIEEGGLHRVIGDNTGRFRAPLPPRGLMVVTADSVEHGFTSYGPFEVEPGQDHLAGTIALGSHAKLEGVVVGPAGTRIEGVTVRAYPLDAPPETVRDPGLPDPEAGWWDSPPAARRFDAFWKLTGLPWGEVQTDSDGHFAFRGLLHGTYELVTILATGRDRHQAPIENRMGHGRFATGQWAELTEDRYLLTGRVMDSAGVPLIGAQLSIFIEGTEHAISSQASRPDAVFTHVVYPGTAWLVAGWFPAPPVVQRIEILPGAYRVETEVVLDFGAPRGELELTVIDGDRQPVDALQVEVKPVLPAGARVSRNVSLGTGFLTPSPATELPPGEYTVDIRTGDPWDSFFLPEHRVVQIEAGQTRRLDVQLRAGGRFRLRLHAISNPGSVTPHEAIVRVEAPNGETRELHGFRHNVPDGSHSPGGRYSFSEAPELSHLLESGPHVLSIEVQGFEPVERVLQIAPEHISDVEITLVPR